MVKKCIYCGNKIIKSGSLCSDCYIKRKLIRQIKEMLSPSVKNEEPQKNSYAKNGGDEDCLNCEYADCKKPYSKLKSDYSIERNYKELSK